MILRSSPASPFGRKVKIAASILGLSGRITVVVADTTSPTDSLRRENPLRLEALADGICDAALLQVYETRFRDASRAEPSWLEHQAGKVTRGLDALEAAVPTGPVTVGHVALACTLGYLDLRFSGAWRETSPSLVAWLDAFAAEVPAFEATRFKP